MDSLYSLALLLTGGHEAAEQCFLAALQDCQEGRDVFRERARSWSRRAIIKQAIRQLQAPSGDVRTDPVPEAHEFMQRLLQLRAFERLVFAMTVLERYSDRECAALLECQVRDVERARADALLFLSKLTQDDLAFPLADSSRPEATGAIHIGGNL